MPQSEIPLSKIFYNSLILRNSFLKHLTVEILDQNQQQTRTPIDNPVSVGQWMITMLLMAIPIVNIVMLFVWAFGGNTPLSKANWAKASLLWMVIGITIAIVILGLFASAFFAGSLF